MAVDFKALLKKPVDSIERPKPLPAGTFFGVVQKYEFGESKEKKTPFLRLLIGITGPGDDIDPSDLDGVDLAKKSLRKDYYLTDDALYRLTELIASCGIPTEGRMLDECIPDLQGASMLCSVTQRSSPDGSEIYNDLDKLAGQPA